jgi:transposase-like protein
METAMSDALNNLTTLNEASQCPACRRKPRIYKRQHMKFCAGCCREFDLETGQQIENWAWKKTGTFTFERT